MTQLRDTPASAAATAATAATSPGTKTAEEELFLLRLRYREGRVVEAGANKPFLLDNPDNMWVVYSGKVDIFVTSQRNGRAAGPRRHLVRLEAGQACFGVRPLGEDNNLRLLAVGTPDTRALRIARTRLQEYSKGSGRPEEVNGLLEGWVEALSRAIAPPLPPRDCLTIDAGGEVQTGVKDNVCAQRGVVWVKGEAAPLLLLGREDLVLPADGLSFPLTSRTWIETPSPGTLTAADTASLAANNTSWQALDAFNNLVLTALQRETEQRASEETARLDRKSAADQQVVRTALERLAAILETGPEQDIPLDAGAEPLFTAVSLIGKAAGISIRQHPNQKRDGVQSSNPLGDIARSSRVRVRAVTLEDDWWRRDNGPMLAFARDDDRPVALVPVTATRYKMVDPVKRVTRTVTDKEAATFAATAYTLYRSFPDQPITARMLLKFGLAGCRGDLLMLTLMGLAAGVLVMLTPIVTGIIFDSVIPGGERGRLAQITGALIIGALAAMLFELTRGVAVLRIAGRMDAGIQSAVWDRLLSLPVPFFRRYSSGELSSRAMSVNAIRQTLTGIAVSSILGVVFSLFNVALLFYYNVQLAIIAVLLVLLILAVTFLLSYRQVRQRRPLIATQSQISGLVVQLINGIAKLRVTGAEGRAFAVWAKAFTNQRKITFRVRTTGNSQLVFDAMMGVFTSLAIFLIIAVSLSQKLSAGTFLGFNAAFSQFLAAMGAMSIAVITALNVVPIFEQMTPILDATPEVDVDKSDPGEMTGDVEVSHVSFRYKPDGPLVLDDVSLHIQPGEFIAIVGPSGSGKSSLLRILLKFETPESGGVYYDGQDLAGLDVQSVRRQIGVVLQNGQLMTGAIHTNILGSTGRSIEDAWQAARMAGLDEDINLMPMGMHTVISQGAVTFSGGQRQRLLIARAIVNKPRLLFFDEATSALDSRTQEKVSQSLERLQATRVVIAHRLSTIVKADRIFVLVGGRLVQSGTYQQLLNQPGPFAELARRQLA